MRSTGLDLNSNWAAGCTTIQEEFKVIRKAYHKRILEVHPDKGGDAAIFRDVNTNFELIREMFEKQSVTTFQPNSSSTEKTYEVKQEFEKRSWEFYASVSILKEIFISLYFTVMN